MKSILVAIAFFGSVVFSVDLTFASGVNCTGQAEFGRRDLPSISCFNITAHTPTKSVILANLVAGDTVSFFSDAECQDELYSASSDLCYTELTSRVMSFRIQTSDKKEDTVANTDVVVYPVVLTDFSGLSQSSPYSIDINYSVYIVGVVALTVGGLFQISNIATGCAAVDTTDVLSVWNCIAGPVATIFAAVGGYLISKGVGSGPGPVEEFINMGTGTVSGKRDLIDSANFDYMSHLMKRDRGDGFDFGEHVGFQARDMGNGVVQRSPLYEIEIGNSGKYHMAAFLDERSGTFTNHLHRAEESNLKPRYNSLGKRQISYDDVRWNTNGLDFNYCLFQGDTSGFSSDPTTLWQTAYDQLKCLVPPGQTTFETTSTGYSTTLYNEAGTLVASIDIVGYTGSTPGSGVTVPSCANPTSSINQDCIVA